MTDTFQSAYQEEQHHLDSTLREIWKQYEALRQIPVYKGDDFTEQVLEDNREQRRQKLQRAAKEPYFGRLDVREGSREQVIPIYIGKQGVDASERREQAASKPGADPYPLVIDWRAPVASLFYSFTGGLEPASYEAPEGTMTAEVHLKRNLVIRNEQLLRVVDTFDREQGEESVTDEFLIYRLGENKDNKLRDIVSTIQSEQDAIIRAPKNKALFIQGVAGSGKTTVALHRLAYLLYQYQDQIHAERMIIFAPNRMFLDYIGEVLPELGVGNIQQRTFADWALELTGLEERVQLASPMDEIEQWYGSLAERPLDSSGSPGRFKGSLEWMRLLDEFVQHWVERAIPEEDFVPWEGGLLPHATIAHWFRQEYRSYEPAKRLERVAARMQRWLEMELKQELSKSRQQEKKRKGSAKLKSYLKRWAKAEVMEVYKQLLQDDAYAGHLPASVRKQTLASLKRGTVRQEDVATLVYLHLLLHGVTSAHRFDHVVIDEAQDFSPLQVALLDRLAKSHSFTILGDLSQGIHAYAGIEDWQEMRNAFAGEETAYHALTRSYRSTMEIIHFANAILKRGVKTTMVAEPVFRSGNKVRIRHMAPEQTASWAASELERHREQGYQTTAILTRTTEEAREWHERLRALGAEAHLIDGRQQQYSGGISVLPVYLSKGLEFDAVILLHANETHYGMSPLEARLMYVGCTRALHHLTLCADGALSPLLPQSDDEWTVHEHS
ncbi:AAA family ATPase [Paenibacillus melissococcoides]|uniref:DNA 3'-5' helicase n=1 Tax=Paenibacillus melissococcoides TaxID=2912268 RepID=A0ABN8U312_9BACL|nr:MULTISPECIES: 3'-5' exonuclease [Paenibacillus]MEB9893992.1 3'-5' exonuclease [Bacillus cereus]CAH8245370.1 AAA family ATPase [Paenibacillus melissococcoides]CAH8710767.1 AAA family ATPase [Paenibacillus melissococcoides]CAH8711544.1 AAA family ATPase [Paenibacillus melissococcoides]GIO77806.1 DNA helicase [Paenibacillus dendritiformis]